MCVKGFRGLACSRRALAIPVTYLILFASLIVIISAAYAFAVTRISVKGAQLRVLVAKQNMQTLDDVVRSVAWSSGSSKTVYMKDCGGVFQMHPKAKSLIINLTDGQTFSQVVFNDSLGKAFYMLDDLAKSQEGAYVRGDSRAIIDHSAFTITQLYFERGESAQQLVLCYRPMATILTIGTSNGKPLNIIRVYITSLASSQMLTLYGSFHLKVSMLNIESSTVEIMFNSSVSSLALEALSEGTKTTIWLPIESTSEGAVVSLEVVVCRIQVRRVNI
ncbi:MAG: hypothetical protein QXZ47_01530 [Candidatus Bathyarchaeia archaeon]